MSEGYYDLGTYSRPVTTGSEEAQRWFDRGLAWTYGYNHDEAVACYRRALDADPACAMAWWGVAYAVGPNYNKPWEAFDEGDAAPFARDCVRRGGAGAGTRPERDEYRAVPHQYP